MDNIKVTFKILIIVMIAAIGMIVVGARGAININEANNEMERLYSDDIRSIELLGQAQEGMRIIQVRAMQSIADPGRAAEVQKSQAKVIATMDQNVAEYIELSQNDKYAEDAKEMQGCWNNFKTSMPKVIDAVQQGGPEAGMAEYNKAARQDTEKLRDILDKLNTDVQAGAKEANEINKAEGNKSIMIMLVTTVVCILVQLLASYKISNAIKQPLDIMLHVCGKLAKGNFRVNTAPSTRKDEFGDVHRGLYNMTISVGKLLNSFSHTTEQIAAASQQLNSSSMESANTATSVAESVSEAAAIVVQQQTAVNDGTNGVSAITNAVDGIKLQAQEISANAGQAANKAAAGNKVVGDSVSQIQNVEATVRTTAELVNKLGERSQEIGAIVDTISDLAGQTNLLALNAAIEAARAGEQGRGFAVVAEEVRKLAEQSATAAQQIAGLIGGIQSDTSKAVSSMDTGCQEVAKGASSVEGLKAVFEEISQLVAEISDKINNMSDSVAHVADQSIEVTRQMNDIDKGSKQVADDMQSISAATEEQSASAEEIASASDSLARQAQEVQENLQKFQF